MTVTACGLFRILKAKVDLSFVFAQAGTLKTAFAKE